MGKIQSEINQILIHLSKTTEVTNAEVMELLGVSDSTARRLLNTIAAQGLAQRTRGGLRSNNTAKNEYNYESHQVMHEAEKRALVSSAVQMIESNDSIFLDWGTTAYCFSEALARRFDHNELRNITVFTNALTNISILQSRCELIALGGRYRVERKDFAGYICEETLKRLHFKKCFICADGFYPSMGFTTYDFESARMDELVIKNSSQSFILMDSSKYLQAATANCTGEHILDALITDSNPPANMYNSVMKYVHTIVLPSKNGLTE